MKKLIAGNWKMNGSLTSNKALLEAVLAGWGATAQSVDVAVCAPCVYVPQLQQLLVNTGIVWGAQDISAHDQGAFTGEVSGAMLREFGCRYVLVGHSERRHYHGESDSVVAAKAQKALSTGITPIVCVGETLAERESGSTMTVVKRQLAAVIHAVGHCMTEVVVAYEPVWAIGTGKTATPEQAQEVHAVLRTQLQAACGNKQTPRILYGGSMNAANASALLCQQDIDGGLIGGAALKAADFLSIIDSASRFHNI